MMRGKLRLRDLDLNLFSKKRKNDIDTLFLYRYKRKLVYGRYRKYFFVVLKHLKVLFWFQLKLFRHLNYKYYYMLKNIKVSNKSIYKRVKLYWLQILWRSQGLIKFKKFHINLVKCMHRYRRHAKKINKLRYFWQKLKGIKKATKYQLPRQFMFDFTRVYVRRKRRKYRRVFDEKKKEFVLAKFNLQILKNRKINVLPQVKSFILKNAYNICSLIQNANFFDKYILLKSFYAKKYFS